MVQRKREEEGRRPRISVSLDQEDFDWVQSFNGASDSYTVARIVRAARLAGLHLGDATNGGALEEFADWLATKRKNKLATELHGLLSEFIGRK